MQKIFKILLITAGAVVLAGLIFLGGLAVGRRTWGTAGAMPMGMPWNSCYRMAVDWDMNADRPAYSMMSGSGYGMAFGSALHTNTVTPLTIDQARQAVEIYLKDLNNPDLEIKEIMVFDNNAYARITEKSTGIGAMELLVDPSSLTVFPEYGPNRMWNLKYGHMGMASWGMGRSDTTAVSANMPITPDQARSAAQQYLDQQFPGYQAATEPDAFYGYYTLDILKNNQPTGMLSVNGFDGQVFLHTWHGTFIEMSE